MCCVCGCTCVVYVGVHVWCMWVYMCCVCGCTCVVYVGVHVWCMWVYMCGVCGCTCVVMWVYISIYDCSQFTFMYQIFLQELVAELGDLLYQVRVYMSIYLYMSVYVRICVCMHQCTCGIQCVLLLCTRVQQCPLLCRGPSTFPSQRAF